MSDNRQILQRLRDLLLSEEPEEMGEPENTYQVFMDAGSAFAEAVAPDWIPFLPTPGKYSHPTYGDIDLTRESNEQRVSSVKNRVYQEHIPLDAEHQTKLSGAVGYIRDMRMNDDGSADAQIEWSERGKKLRSGGGFRYVSPEWFRTWRDPATGEEHRNVIAGGAITSRPFFKDKVLRALVASEAGVGVFDEATVQFWAPAARTPKEDLDGTGEAGDGSTGLDGTVGGGSDEGGQAIAGGEGAERRDASGASGAGEGVSDGRTQAATGTDTQSNADSDTTRATEGLAYWFRDFSPEKREALAQSGDAMPDGSFPIPDVDALKRAIQAFGRAKDPAATKAHIKKRAKALGHTDLIPEDWSEKEIKEMGDEQTFTAAEIEAKIETAKKAAVEEVTATFAEQLTTERTAREAAQAEAETLKGSVAELQKQGRVVRFTELVSGRGGSNDGAPWVGDQSQHVEMLETLASRFGEEDPLFVKYIEQQTAAAQQIKEANLFAEIGTAHGGAVSDPERRLDQLTEERLKTHPNESQEQAYAEVLKSVEGRKLYDQIPTVRGQ